MIEPLLEEQAALAALGWADDPARLQQTAAQDAELADAVRQYADLVACLAYDAAPRMPPAALRERVMTAIASAVVAEPVDEPRPVRPAFSLARFFNWPSPSLMPYAVAACLMGLALLQAGLILLLDSRLDALRAPARHDSFTGVQLVDLAPRGDHGAARVMVAWNAKTSCGMLSMDKMPAPPPGHSYQLWVLDPSKPAPVNAGVVPPGATAKNFIAGQVRLPGRPGFAVSLEGAGGATGSSPGEILFAVAPSP